MRSISLFLLSAVVAAVATKTVQAQSESEILTVMLNENVSVRLRKIECEEYRTRKATAPPDAYKVVYDVEKARQMLKGRVELVEMQCEEDGEVFSRDVMEVRIKNGTKIIVDWCNSWECLFIAYYPEVDVLNLFSEGEGDYPIDLNDGSSWHPGKSATSPNRRWRIDGRYSPASDFDYYTLEKWNDTKKKYELILDLSESRTDFYPYIEYCSEWFWVDNYTVLFTKHVGDEWRQEFYEITIIENTRAQ